MEQGQESAVGSDTVDAALQQVASRVQERFQQALCSLAHYSVRAGVSDNLVENRKRLSGCVAMDLRELGFQHYDSDGRTINILATLGIARLHARLSLAGFQVTLQIWPSIEKPYSRRCLRLRTMSRNDPNCLQVSSRSGARLTQGRFANSLSLNRSPGLNG